MPWLVSLAMWENCMRYVTEEPITVGELEARARTGTNLDGMRRWGYVTIDGTARKIHKGRPGPGAVLRVTATGLRARQVWLPLPGLIEQRWRDRFGEEPDPAASRGQVARLTPGGLDAQHRYREVAGAVEQRWRARFTGAAVDALRAALEPLAIAPAGGPPPLFAALEPYPDNWRASVRRPTTLPHYPMVLHRGGYPDGS